MSNQNPTKQSKLALKAIPKTPSGKTSSAANEEKYWNKFKFPILLKQYAAVTHINFSPIAPHDFAVTSSTRVQMFDPNTNEVKKTISKFKDIAYSANYRSDGRLIIAGCELPVARMFDTATRSLLREFRGHQRAVHTVKFSPSNVHAVSGSDDKTVKFWDISTAQAISTWTEHADYVRCGSPNMSSPNIWVTGSYDHTVKLWDNRTNESILSMDHGHPVEEVLVFPGGSLVISAGSNFVKIWDILGGGRLLHTLNNHQKTVTSLVLNQEGSRLLTGGLDQMVKVYDVKDYSVLHTMSYPAPILSVGLSADSTHLAVGMSDGMLSIRTRQVKLSEITLQKEKRNQLRIGAYRYFLKGKHNQGSRIDTRILAERKIKLRNYEKNLKNFRFKESLDQAIATNESRIGVSMIQELIRRGGLTTALAGRNEETLIPIIAFLSKNINNPNYSSTLLDVASILLDTYSTIIGLSQTVDNELKKLKLKLHEEITFQKQLFQLVGSLDMIMSSSLGLQQSTAASFSVPKIATNVDQMEQ